jgi:ribosome-binding protein aMBF1 (putative translation factor)
MTNKCELCGNESTKLNKISDIKLCEDCYNRLSSIMKYKNVDDIIDEDKNLLMRFCNKLISLVK